MIIKEWFLKYFFVRNAGGRRNEARIVSSSTVHVLYRVTCVIVEN